MIEARTEKNNVFNMLKKGKYQNMNIIPDKAVLQK